MKASALIFILSLYAIVSFGQKDQYSGDLKGPENSGTIIRNKHIRYIPVYNENLEDMCAKYRSIKTSGIVLMALGGGLIATGGVMMATAKNGKIYNDNEGGMYRGNSPIYTGGTVAVVIGSLSFISGIPLTAIGATKSKRICNKPYSSTGNPAYLQMQTGENGVGLGLKF